MTIPIPTPAADGLPELPEPDGVIVVGTQALRAFTAETLLAFRAEGIRIALAAQGELLREMTEGCDHWKARRDFYRTRCNELREDLTAALAARAAEEVPASESIIAELQKLPFARIDEIDGEESDGTPRHWRARPFISLRKAERIIREALTGSPRKERT